jgi:hypothetical protein
MKYLLKTPVFIFTFILFLNIVSVQAYTETCLGEFDFIHGSRTNPGNVNTHLKVSCDYESIATIEDYHMYQLVGSGKNDITLVSNNPRQFEVPGTFAVPGKGCDPNSYYMATARVRIDTPDGEIGYLPDNEVIMKPNKGC